jgi:hypothetical protein
LSLKRGFACKKPNRISLRWTLCNLTVYLQLKRIARNKHMLHLHIAVVLRFFSLSFIAKTTTEITMYAFTKLAKIAHLPTRKPPILTILIKIAMWPACAYALKLALCKHFTWIPVCRSSSNQMPIHHIRIVTLDRSRSRFILPSFILFYLKKMLLSSYFYRIMWDVIIVLRWLKDDIVCNYFTEVVPIGVSTPGKDDCNHWTCKFLEDDPECCLSFFCIFRRVSWFHNVTCVRYWSKICVEGYKTHCWWLALKYDYSCWFFCVLF